MPLDSKNVDGMCKHTVPRDSYNRARVSKGTTRDHAQLYAQATCGSAMRIAAFHTGRRMHAWAQRAGVGGRVSQVWSRDEIENTRIEFQDVGGW